MYVFNLHVPFSDAWQMLEAIVFVLSGVFAWRIIKNILPLFS